MASLNPTAQLFDGPTNMAADAQLLQEAEAGHPGCRIYFWDGPWVSLGRFQEPESALKPDWQTWVRRPTGGRAVLHGHDVTVAIAYPRQDRMRSVREVYRELTRPLIAALRTCGVKAELGERTTITNKGSGEDCFAFASANDIVDLTTHSKICGCALRVTGKAALLQASIPYKGPLVDPSFAIVGGVAHLVQDWRHADFAQVMLNEWTSFAGLKDSR